MSWFISCGEGRGGQSQHPCGNSQHCFRASSCTLCCWLHSVFAFLRKQHGTWGAISGQPACFLANKCQQPFLPSDLLAVLASHLLFQGQAGAGREKEWPVVSPPSMPPPLQGTGLCTEHEEGLQGDQVGNVTPQALILASLLHVLQASLGSLQL